MRSPADVIDGWAHGVSGSVVHSDRVVHVEHVWNTAISITIARSRGREDGALAAIDWCSQFFARVDATFSTYRPETEASFFRNGLTWRAGPSADFAAVLEACADLRDRTHGAFDPWAVPGGFDPSGYVKGWAAQRASDELARLGFDSHLGAVGDDVAGSGSGWSVGNLSPHDGQEVVEVVALRDSAMATSGRYERGDHVTDPRTGSPAVGVDSATVVGPDAGAADALASAAMVDGRGSMAWFSSLGPAWSLHLVIGDSAFTHGPAFDLR